MYCEITSGKLPYFKSEESPLINIGCTAGYFAGGNTCYLRKGTITGSNLVPRPNTDRVAYIRGTCASLEGQSESRFTKLGASN
jgi:hypothetical protein